MWFTEPYTLIAPPSKIELVNKITRATVIGRPASDTLHSPIQTTEQLLLFSKPFPKVGGYSDRNLTSFLFL